MNLAAEDAGGNGTRYRVLTRASATAGTSYSVEVLCHSSARGFSAELPCSLPGHVHKSQDETVSVVAGRLGWIKGQDRGLLQAGDTLLIEKGSPHILFNADNTTDVLYTISHSPAGALAEAFFEGLAGLGWDYTSLDHIHPLQVLVLYDAADTVMTDLPSVLQPAVKHVLLPVARLLGFKARYPSHSSAAAQPVSTAAGKEDPAGTAAAAAAADEHAADAAQAQQRAPAVADTKAAGEAELQQALHGLGSVGREEL
ncbi:hypothetical protein COO60DRAFT_1703693 [Scenedesmus sp. NREL 46B-D3]|nr:hypothetical protein COO60DRAFT_1703693 [Scenedesmus sp. NREL 46B-D3]